MTFKVGDEVWYMPGDGIHKDNYHCIVRAVYNLEVFVSFVATGRDHTQPKGKNLGDYTFPCDHFKLKGPPLTQAQIVQKKTQYLWNKSKWGKAHPLTQ